MYHSNKVLRPRYISCAELHGPHTYGGQIEAGIFTVQDVTQH